MGIAFDPRRWPLAFKAPLLVALFMLVVSVVITNAVLSRLKETQEQHLTAMSTIYLNGLASAVLPHVLRADIWEVFDALERSSGLEGGFGKPKVVIINSRGETLASTDPRTSPVMAHQTGLDGPFAGNQNLSVDADRSRAVARRALVYQDRRIGTIYADYDIEHLLSERRDVLQTLIITNAAIALLLAGLGYLVIRRMLTPLNILSASLDRSLSGPVEPISAYQLGTDVSEFGHLFRRFNAMADAVNERQVLTQQLANEERLASLGRLTAGMAHEINNPLGGLFNAIDTLKRHGERPSVRVSSLDLIERGLRGIRDVVRAALATYRTDRDPRFLTSSDLDDLRLLIKPELARQSVKLNWKNDIHGEVTLPASALRQILLNLLLNASQASPENADMLVHLYIENTRLVMEVEDQGAGLPTHTQKVIDAAPNQPAPITDGGGLGLWMTRRIVSDLDGTLTAETSALGGTLMRISIPIPHATIKDLKRVA